MPYNVKPSGDEYCIYKEGEDDPLYCHQTEEAANEQMQALYASEETKQEKFSSITYNGVTVQATAQRPSSRDDKKYMRVVRYKGDERTVHYGDPNMEIRRDNDDARGNFNSRHNCSEKKDPFSPGFWSCYNWKKSFEPEEFSLFPSFAKFTCYKSADGTKGVVEAPGVLFDPNGEQKDLDMQYFTEKTYFGQRDGDGVDATLNHRLPIFTKSEEVNTLLAEASRNRFKNPVRSFRDKGALIGQHILDLRDEFEAWVFDMAGKGAFSWSTGTAGHMAEWDDETGEIKQWPIIEWAYTPTPAQPLNPRITPVKTIKDLVFENITFRSEPEIKQVENVTTISEEEPIKVIQPAAEEEVPADKGAEDARQKELQQEIGGLFVEIEKFELSLIGD